MSRPTQDRVSIELAQMAEDELERRRIEREVMDQALSSTNVFGRLTGSNSHEPSSGKYPWIGFQRKIADYLDSKVPNIGVPIKPVLVSRGHLKTEIGCHALARFALSDPEKRNCIIGASLDRSQSNLSNVGGIYQLPVMQEMFGSVLYGLKDNAYTADDILLRRSGVYRERSIESLGRNSRTAGKHYNGVIWIDDIVTEQDDFENSDVTEKVMRLLSHIIEYVADPGCQIWITATRYHDADPYGKILDPESEFRSVIAPGGPIVLDCFAPEDGKPRRALYPFKFCMGKDEQRASVKHDGTTYHGVIRKSLVEMEKRTNPREWYAQMLNRPMRGAGVGFDPKWFDNTVDIEGKEFKRWIAEGRDPIIETMFGKGRLGPIITHIVGDPSYRNGRENDYATLFVVAQTATNHFVVLDGFRSRLGYQGDVQYARQALWFKSMYEADLLGIEKHAKESIETVFRLIAAEEGKTIHLAQLPNNSSVAKKDRIATLIPIASEGRLHWCKNTEFIRLAVREEASRFPGCCDGNGLHDDALDGLANITQIFRGRSNKTHDYESASWVRRTPKRIQRILDSRAAASQWRGGFGGHVRDRREVGR
jgi:hypothetical protein